MTIRSVLLKLHLWVALSAGAFLILIGVSGALLVFAPAYDRAMSPELLKVTPQPTRLPLQALLDRSRSAGTPAILLLPQRPDESAHVFVLDAQRRPSSVYLNPYSGDVLGVRTVAEQQKGLSLTVRRFHKNLLLGVRGSQVVGFVTILTVFMALSGLVLWWPRKIVKVKASASWPRINFDLHNVVGLFSSAILLVLALTGIAISYPQVSGLIKNLDSADLVEPRSTLPPGDRRPLTVDELVAIGGRALPDSTTVAFSMPKQGSAVVNLAQRFPEDARGANQSRVWLDMYSGGILRVDNSRQPQAATRGSRLGLTIAMLHVGVLYGRVTETLVFLGSLSQVVLVVTGTLIWWRRKFRRARPGTATDAAA